MKLNRLVLYLPLVAFFVSACGDKAPAPNPGVVNPADAPYSVTINPANFVAVIDNPYFPRIPGARYVFEGQTDEGVERIEIEVMATPREVMGVPTTVVRDTVYVDEILVEDTFDWFAQDADGNVWYFGEAVDNYENGQLANHDGSWEAGVDGALPGVVMYSDPAAYVGQAYRQEYYAGEAEDMAQVLSADEVVTVPFGSFENVVQTEDWTPLEPGLREHKFYAPGVGVVKEVNLATGEEIVLLEVNLP